MSPSAPLAWMAALAAAAYPTWDTWKSWFDWSSLFTASSLSEEHYGGFTEGIVGCVRLYDSIDRSPFLPLRDDLTALTELAMIWAVPVLAVLVALVRRHSATAGPRAAWVLALIALVRPLSADYRGDGICSGSLPMFSPDWFEALSGGWGLWELCLLAAALLVLLASDSPTPPISGRRALTAAMDTLVVYGLVALAPLLIGDESLRVGLLSLLWFDDIRDDPARLLVLVLPVVYLLLRYGRWGKKY
ncbi:hypothetical protein LDL08_28175 [Nonomuraea glycinis]|uniref:Uncharacterized protein n=1 Tax=Nonomuraea glycinis TaxID=2047744 RepID=A0A918A9B4_9ACTN|nr:hypothetical protein [Nonomuraea glycinis]MCA2180065.1 hypothetical protein [Nonomuraea glycinis]GGP10809.1 hypothetical protein GCM10012278_51940 [Nonomuraea glycinis]